MHDELISRTPCICYSRDACQKSGNDFRIRSLHVFGKRSDEHLESVPSEKESESENLASLSQHVHSTSLR